MTITHHGYILIADITGYTSYLSRSELDHAQETLAALLNLLISHTNPPLVISRLAGDAVISYGLRDNFFQGQTFVELIEDTYVAFRRAIDLMVLNTTCGCNACKNIGSLDLKFFVHYGSFALQKLGAHEEMVGTDVNAIHRLLKNTVTERTGARAYALYTDAAILQLGLEEICAAMAPHEETYEHVGTVPVWVQDMHSVWEAKKDEGRIRIPPDRELMRFSTEIRAAPEVVWDYLLRPEHYNVFAGGTKTVFTEHKDGRMAAGSVYQCYHGDSFLAMAILEWQPFERTLVQAAAPVPVKGVTMMIEVTLEPVPAGTRFTQIFGKAEGPIHGRTMANLMFKGMSKQAQIDVDNFSDHIEADLAGRGPTPESTPPSAETIAAAARAGLSDLAAQER
jgi:uncharacterized protein YndB with AHSA1/START domain